MRVETRVQLGLWGTCQSLDPLWLDTGSIGATSSWAGSYHVLSMGRHYDDYVITGRTIGLPTIVGIPTAHPYERLTGKIRAAGVTGNIGEAIAAIFARRVLKAGVRKIAHVRPRRPFRRRRAPDYLMRLENLMPGPFSAVVPLDASPAWPIWWPVESKARTTESSSDVGRRDALRQLTAYWSLLVNSQPQIAGYGIIIVFTYRPPREVRASIILPKNPTKLVQELQQNRENIEDSTLRSCLYGC